MLQNRKINLYIFRILHKTAENHKKNLLEVSIDQTHKK